MPRLLATISLECHTKQAATSLECHTMQAATSLECHTMHAATSLECHTMLAATSSECHAIYQWISQSDVVEVCQKESELRKINSLPCNSVVTMSSLHLKIDVLDIFAVLTTLMHCLIPMYLT